MLIRHVTEKSAVKKPNTIYSGACATVNTDFVFPAVLGEEFILGSSSEECKKNNNNNKKILRETFKMELSQCHSSSAQSSDYIFFYAAISLHEYNIIENGRVLKYFSASTSSFLFLLPST